MFNNAITFVLEKEKGYNNDPTDPGGETKYGISKRSYPQLNIRDLTQEDARAIYRTDFWMKCKCDQLPDAIGFVLFDSAVNQGPNAAVRLLQQSLDVPDDGVMGPDTIAAAFRASPGVLVNEFIARRAYQYALNPQIHRFGMGWYRRLIECHQLALEP